MLIKLEPSLYKNSYSHSNRYPYLHLFTGSENYMGNEGKNNNNISNRKNQSWKQQKKKWKWIEINKGRRQI